MLDEPQPAMQFEAGLPLAIARGMNVLVALLQSDTGVTTGRGRLESEQDLENDHEHKTCVCFYTIALGSVRGWRQLCPAT